MNKICLDKVNSMEVSVSFSEVDKDTPFTHREIHMHEEYEVLVNLKGEKLLELSGRVCAFPEGSVVVVKPYEGHRCIFCSKGMHRHFWLLLKIQDDIMETLIEEEKGGNIIQIEAQEFQRLVDVLSMLSQGKSSGYEQYVSVFTMLDIIKKGKSAELLEQKVMLPKDVVLALEYMEKHMAERFTIEDIAKASHVSINTLERHFAEFLQLSPSATLRRKRLITAAKLLSHDMSISEVCDKCGFADYSNFIVSFRRFYGMTPLKYQKNTKKQNW